MVTGFWIGDRTPSAFQLTRIGAEKKVCAEVTPFGES
jgi:hypothetical protein